MGRVTHASGRIGSDASDDRRPRAYSSATGRASSMTRTRRTSPTPPRSGRTRPRTSSSGRTERSLAKPPKLALELPRPARLRRQHAGARAATRSARPRATTPSTPRRCTARPRYANRVYGHARRDSPGPAVAPVLALLLLQRLPAARPAVSGGNHEGDWELVQIRARRGRAARAGRLHPAQALPRARPWTDVQKAGNTPLVYVARGSHANYFGAGSHWTGVWWDQADGKGPQITPTLEVSRTAPRRGCCGRGAGATPRRASCGWTRRARTAPGVRPHWLDPAELSGTMPAPARAGAARAAARDRGAHRRERPIVVRYEAPPEANALAVVAAPRGLGRAAPSRARSRSTRPRARSSCPRTTDRRLDERRRPGGSRLRGRQGQVTPVNRCCACPPRSP